MKWMRNRFLPLSYVVLLLALVVIGCSGKQDPSETLTTCGNASCGDLVMVTTDTSSDGYHYLSPSLSPSGDRILFTADWWALPSEAKDPGDVYYVNYRQMIIIPVREGVQPETDLESQGAELIRLQEKTIRIGDDLVNLGTVLNDDKGDPIWETDETVIFFLKVDRLGNRLFRANLNDPSALPGLATIEPMWLEPTDSASSPEIWQHMEPDLSADRNWLLFTRSGCAIPDSFETCQNLRIWALDMSTAASNGGYGGVAYPLTNEYTRIEKPRFSPNGDKIVFSGGLDCDGGNGSGTEVFTMDFDPAALTAGTYELDAGLQRITYTGYAEGDPLTGILNSYAAWTGDGNEILFVSTRRAPTTTLHDRNIWSIPADGSREPEIAFFSRYDDLDPQIQADGTLLMSSLMGFPSKMLDRLEQEAYDRIKAENEDAHQEDPDVPLLTETQLQEAAADERSQLEYFEGVMAHIYLYRR